MYCVCVPMHVFLQNCLLMKDVLLIFGRLVDHTVNSESCWLIKLPVELLTLVTSAKWQALKILHFPKYTFLFVTLAFHKNVSIKSKQRWHRRKRGKKAVPTGWVVLFLRKIKFPFNISQQTLENTTIFQMMLPNPPLFRQHTGIVI